MRAGGSNWELPLVLHGRAFNSSLCSVTGAKHAAGPLQAAGMSPLVVWELWLGLAYDELGSAEKYGHGHRRKTWNYPII